MPFPNSRTAARVTQLSRTHGIAQKNTMGAYDTPPLRQLEFLLHEAAHWIVLGNPVERMPCRLSSKLEEVFGRIPAVSSDSLEVDAALVTFLAGYRLELWTDPSPIVTSCRRNLKGIAALGPDTTVLSWFRERWFDGKVRYSFLSDELALWFRPSARLIPIADSPFGV